MLAFWLMLVFFSLLLIWGLWPMLGLWLMLRFLADVAFWLMFALAGGEFFLMLDF